VVYATLVERFVSPEAADAELSRYEEEGEDDPAFETGEATIENWRAGDRDIARVAPEGVAPREKK
jgi:hypothetical protein